MTRAVPAIYAPPAYPPRLSIKARFAALILAEWCLSMLIMAAIVTPDPHGYGTHQRLGMSPCPFLAHVGIPCPACGMTTSWAWFVRGNLEASLYVQPMGTLLAIINCAVLWGALYVAATGKPFYRLLRTLSFNRFITWMLVLAIIAWAWKIWIFVRHVDGWPG